FPVSWNATGAAKYKVEWAKQVASGSTYVTSSWAAWLNPTTAKSATFGASNHPVAPALGTTYMLRVSAIDAYGNVTAAKSVRAVVPYDDRSSGPVWTGTWTLRSDGNAFRATERLATKNTSRMKFTTTGRQFVVVGTRATSTGRFLVYIDGKLKATVDTHD